LYHWAVRLLFASLLLAAMVSAAGVDTRDSRGYTPLMWAAANGDVAKVQELIRQGARVNLRSPDGPTAFSVSMANGHGKIPPLLVRAGADCQPPNANWRKELSSKNAQAAEFMTEVERLGTELI
jgi:ankyrin repeat protein